MAMTRTQPRYRIGVVRIVRMAAPRRRTTLLGALAHGLWNLYGLVNDPADILISIAISLLVIAAAAARPRRALAARS
jgi:hypothetical protein